ncbi:hypothetical protein KR018_011129, partial [Drosophila ironensis]
MMSRAVHGIVSNMRLILPRLEASIRGGSVRSKTQLTEHFAFPDNVTNEELRQYKEGTPDREELESALHGIMNRVEHVPILINGKELTSERDLQQVLPYAIRQPIASYGHAHRIQILMAIDEAVRAQESWDKTSISTRIGIWERGAYLIAGPHRCRIVASLMLGQGKTLRQAETDVAELVDLMRITPIFLRELANYEPLNNSPDSCRNTMRLRGLTGFVAAISPFNFTSVAANLVFTPALMGNTVIWKPSDSAILSNWYVLQAMLQAGLPENVVSFVPAEEVSFARAVTQNPKLAGISFTGTSSVLKVLWQMVGDNIHQYENYPRLVGEGGGKNFHFVHPSADPDTVLACTVRAAFEYAGQKCSSCGMLYVPASMWRKHIKERLLDVTASLIVGCATYLNCFCSAMINRRAYERTYMWLKYISRCPTCKILMGGECDKREGYFVDPTVVRVYDLDNIFVKEEIMAPILGVYVYPDDEVDLTMSKVAEVNHGLCGSVFARNEEFIDQAFDVFRSNVGNLNVNNKCTGSMVGQQPFGAGHMTGTSDKLGGPHSLLRWTSPQLIKESYKPHASIFYPHMKI